jgi:iron complex outermembrane receptor protein
MALRSPRVRRHLLCGIALIGLSGVIAATPAIAETPYHIRPQSLDLALRDFGMQSGLTILADAALTAGKTSRGISAAVSPETALDAILRGSGLTFRRQGKIFVIRPAREGSGVGNGQAAAPAVVTASQAQADDTTQDIIVTAQKRRESIQKVPIAVSAFTAKTLDAYKIEGGAELERAVPNVNFSKNNFSGYNFSIRGVGTKAVSVSTDPAVAISYNNTPLLRNRLFEQEYFDVERVEVLRGPQGTLYGRNATAGVVNMISNKPSNLFEGVLKGEVGNYDSRRVSGMLNVPLTDTFGVRVAGAYTNRNGFDYNTVTDRAVNGRDLWSVRATAQWRPVEDFTAALVWEHFSEKDDRSRTGKQLCHTDPGPSEVGGVPVPEVSAGAPFRPLLSQGCANGSLYDAGAYGVPNGLSLPYVAAAGGLIQLGFKPDFSGFATFVDPNLDPYAGIVQSRNLREIATKYDPTFQARNDIFQLNLEWGVRSNIKLYSQSLFTRDYYHSTQDYNRFNSVPVVTDSVGLYSLDTFTPQMTGFTPGGVFVDPQLGASNTLIAVDMVNSHSEQWSQELRLQSSNAAPFNFSLGANYLHFKINEDYYVFSNFFTAIAQGYFNGPVSQDTLPPPCPAGATTACIYIDPNPLDKINGQGHNYFRSDNVYKVDSYAAFGEAYWRATPDLKITAGLRYTDDRKVTTPVPSQLLLSPGVAGGGYVNSGYPANPDIHQSWQRFTGRLAVDWSPKLAFTDSTLVYGSYSRGYKAGGTNPPGIDADPQYLEFYPQPTTYKPEYVNAFEVGLKNTFDQGRLTLNGAAFFYDYKGYQISKIVDRTALNENFNARTWGAELESSWRPLRNLLINANVGYLGTRLGRGSSSIDVMNRTQGDSAWTLVRPWVQLTSSCIAPTSIVQNILRDPGAAPIALTLLCGGVTGLNFGTFKPGGTLAARYGAYDLATAPNHGQGIAADVSGNELPNAPHWTLNFGVQYAMEAGDWTLTPRADFYRQSASWARIYNTAIDRLHAWNNTNLSLTLDQRKWNVTFQLYVKNVFDAAPITDAFINSDDSGLTTNVFTLDPRIIGFSIAKRF